MLKRYLSFACYHQQQQSVVLAYFSNEEIHNKHRHGNRFVEKIQVVRHKTTYSLVVVYWFGIITNLSSFVTNTLNSVLGGRLDGFHEAQCQVPLPNRLCSAFSGVAS